MPGGMGVVIAYSIGGPDVAEVKEDTVVVSVEFEEEDVAGELAYNSKAPTPAATATAPAPAYFRKRRLEGFAGVLFASTKETQTIATRQMREDNAQRVQAKHTAYDIQDIRQATGRQAIVNAIGHGTLRVVNLGAMSIALSLVMVGIVVLGPQESVSSANFAGGYYCHSDFGKNVNGAAEAMVHTIAAHPPASCPRFFIWRRN